MNDKVSPKRFALYMCGLIVSIFIVGMVVFFVTRPFLHEWAAVPAFVFVVVAAAIAGVLLGNAVRSGGRRNGDGGN